ncbi:Ras guanine nucleotide exchange factor A [Thecamonas trahens ATCC 50062]|uniref:Ras guanine nucleotide exchange factor A n=1 Tax=Thecamonas trahens ATCC 50062 TaxID=461836 RepID=A0A0L0D775_THETB|nr:Ras guanine nucleotide exchange factor A [Thecamonas trahens ATCC 50062]KNC48232.1 Ras guanine nucleotide exchange factor A [Thecamonas trahens ATCC 50062]|eukprot:XP_013758801.1 Ras guanine nucleotide exchange factor A [Thecamonas trahens ATCC 50062]
MGTQSSREKPKRRQGAQEVFAGEKGNDGGRRKKGKGSKGERAGRVAGVGAGNGETVEVPDGSVVNLAGCSLEEVPMSLVVARCHGSTANLHVLVLSDNNITAVPESVVGLCNLTFLSLANNALTFVPACISELVSLVELDLSGNALTALPDGLDLSRCSNLAHLSLADNALSSFDVRLPQTSLARLDLSHNAIEALPENALSSTSALLDLNLAHNSLDVLSSSVGRSTSLLILDLSHNALKSVPASLYSLRALEQLFLAHNELASLPSPGVAVASSGSVFPALAVFDASHNKLTKGTGLEWIAKLPALRTVRLNDNAVADFPPALADLAKRLWSCDLTKQRSSVPRRTSTFSALAASDAQEATAAASSRKTSKGDSSIKAMDKLLKKLDKAFQKAEERTKKGLGKLGSLMASTRSALEAANDVGRVHFVNGGGMVMLVSLLLYVRDADDDGEKGAREAHEALMWAVYAALRSPVGLRALTTIHLPAYIMPEFREQAAKSATLPPKRRGTLLPDGTIKLDARRHKRSPASATLQRVLTHLLMSMQFESMAIREVLLRVVYAVLDAQLTPHASSVVVLVFSATTAVRGLPLSARFKPLVSSLLCRESIALQQVSMELINKLVNSPTKLRKRIAMRSEFTALGLNAIMEFLLACDVEAITQVILAFEDDRAADEEETAAASRARAGSSTNRIGYGSDVDDNDGPTPQYVDRGAVSPVKAPPRSAASSSKPPARKLLARAKSSSSGSSSDSNTSDGSGTLSSSSSYYSSYYSGSTSQGEFMSFSTSIKPVNITVDAADTSGGDDDAGELAAPPESKASASGAESNKAPLPFRRPRTSSSTMAGSSASLRRRRPLPPLPKRTMALSSGTIDRKRAGSTLRQRTLSRAKASANNRRSMASVDNDPSLAEVLIAIESATGTEVPVPDVSGAPGEPSATDVLRARTGTTGSGRALPSAARGDGTEPLVTVEVAIHHRLLRMSAFIGEATVVQISADSATTGLDLVAALLELNPLFDTSFSARDYGLVLASWDHFQRFDHNPAEYPLISLDAPILELMTERRTSLAAASENRRWRRRRRRARRRAKKKAKQYGESNFLEVDASDSRSVSLSEVEGEEESLMVHLKLAPWEFSVKCSEIPQLVGDYLVDPSEFCGDITRYILRSSQYVLEPLGKSPTDLEDRYSLHFVPHADKDGSSDVEILLKDENVLKDYPQLMTLAQYGELTLRAQPIKLRLEVGGAGATEVNVEVEADATFGDVVTKVGHMFGLAAADEYGVFVVIDGFESGPDELETEGMWMETAAKVREFRSVLQSSRVQFKKAPQRLLVSHGSDERELVVSLNVSLSILLPVLCAKMGLDPEGFFVLRKGVSTPVPLSGEITLAEAGVSVGSAIALKKRDDGTIPLARQVYTSIWDDSAPGNGEAEVVRDGALVAARLNALVERLTNIEKLDLLFMEIFLFTHSQFVSSTEVVGKLGERYAVPQDPSLGEAEFRANIQVPLQLVVISVIKEWLGSHWDAGDGEAGAALREFIARIADDGYAKQAAAIEALLVTAEEGLVRPPVLRLTVADASGEHLFGREVDTLRWRAEAAPYSRVPSLLVFASDLQLLDLDEVEMARQITLRDFTVYSMIEPAEFLGLKWTKAKHAAKARNLLNFIERFNIVSNWVTAEIVSEPSLRLRSKVMTYMIKLGSAFAEMGNYSGVMAVIVGLNNAAVSRLKFTKVKVPRRFKKQLAGLESLMDMSGSFKTYRAKLAAAAQAVPYVGVFLTDLVFVEDGNPDYVEGEGGVSMVNVEKVVMVHRIVSQIVHFRERPYNFHIVEAVQAYLDRGEGLVDESELFRRSLAVEPRGKERDELVP